jgi:predicted metal-dependent peptidase
MKKMEIKSTLLNAHDMRHVKNSLIRVSEIDGKEKFRVNMVEYVDDTADNEDDQFFYDMVSHIQFLNPDDEAVAYTTPDTLIYLNSPGKIGESYPFWDFIYCHECLHQLWDTFEVGKRIQANGINYDHEILNIASDCVINDYLSAIRKKKHADGLVTPEYLKEKFGVDYDRKIDTQYTLYLKLIEHIDELKNDPVCQKSFDGKIKPKSVNKQQGPTPPPMPSGKHSKEYIDGWTDAIQDVLDKKVDPLDDKRQPKDTGVKDYDAGYEDCLGNIKQGLEEGVTLSDGGSSGNGGGSDLPQIPWDVDNQSQGGGSDDSKDKKDLDANDAQQSADEAKKAADAAQKAADRAQDAADNGTGSQADADAAQDAADAAKEAAAEAQDAADASKEAADKGDKDAEGKAAQDAADAATKAKNAASDAAGGNKKGSDLNANDAHAAADNAQNSADAAKDSARAAQADVDKKRASGAPKDEIEKAQEAADRAKDAAKDAQEAADKAKKAAKAAADAASKGDSKGENDAAKEAIDAAKNAEDAARTAKEAKNEAEGKKSGSNNKGGGNNKGGSKGQGTGAADFTPEELAEIKKHGEEVIKRYQGVISGALGEFIKKCKSSVKCDENGLEAKAERGSTSWNRTMDTAINAFVRKKIFQKKRRYKTTYKKLKRGTGIVKMGDILQPGRKKIEERMDISIAFYIDRSGSMSGCIDDVFKACHTIADALKKRFKQEKVIDKQVFKSWAFDIQMHELPWGKTISASGGTMDFDKILDYINRHTKDFLINIIITDAGFSVSTQQVKDLLKSIEGMVIFVTNTASHEVEAISKETEFRTQLVYVLADPNFTVK